MEKMPINSTSEIETTRIEDRSVTKGKKDLEGLCLPENIKYLETIQSEQNESSKEHDDLSTSGTILIGKDNKESSETSVNIEVSQQSLDAVADNVEDLKINSMTVSKEPESCEALKSEKNTEIMKNNFDSEGSQVAHTNVTLQDLSPIRFHRVHGKCVKMSNDYFTVEFRSVRFSLGECMVFSSRPIAVGEKVFLCMKLYDFIINDGYFYFSFTDCDPNTMTDLEFPDWHKKVELYWYAFNEEDRVIIFRFCVKTSGEVWCGINDTDMELLFEKININVPLWACIIPAHCITSLKFIDCPNENEIEELKPPSLENQSPPTTHASTELGKTDQKQDMKRDETKLNKKSDLDEKTEENEESASTALGRGNGITPTNVTAQDLSPVRFHRLHGEYIKMSDDYCTARLEIPDLSERVERHSDTSKNKCLVFSSRPIADGEKVYLRLKKLPTILSSHVALGLTNCNPNSITDLKSWNCHKWKHLHMECESYKTIILHFCVKQSGKVTFCLKDDDDILKFGFEKFYISGPLWAVLNLPDNVTNVELITSPKGTKSEEYKLLSEEKPSPPTTDALVELNNLIDNVSNLKLDPTMAKEKPKSYEALEPVANIEKIKSPLNAEVDEISPTDSAVDVPTPLRFHRVHGRFVTISDDYCTAHSAIPKEKLFLATHECFAFSSRPVAINEKVYLRLEKVLSPYIHPFGFGFTDCDPNIVVDLLPKLCTYRTCIFNNCLNNLLHKFGTEGNTFFFVLKPSGEVCYGINDKEIGSLSKVINVKIPLWGLIKLSHDISTVTLIECPKENKSEDLKCPSLQKPIQSYSTEIITDRTENQKAEVLKLPAPSSGVSPEKPTFYWSGGTPVRTTPYESLRFHSVHGKYIKLSPDKTVASCQMPAIEPLCVTHECYVFSSRPIDINEKVHFKLEAVSKESRNAFSFGFTDCDPCIIPNIMDRLCSMSTCIFGNYLIDLPSQFCVKDNYLNFYVTKAGKVHFMVNEKEKGVFHGGVNISSRIWAVIKVTNFVSSVRLENEQQASSKSFVAGEISSAPKTSSAAKEEETGTTSKNTKSEGDDEKKKNPADNNILTGKLGTGVISYTKGQTLFDGGVESSVIRESEFKDPELKTELTVQEAFELNLQTSVTSNTPAELVQPTSSTNVKYKQKPDDYDAIYFGKIVEYHLNRVPEDKRLKCMQKILEVLDNLSE